MPLVLEPDSHYEYVLTNDKDKPEEKRPTFVFKYLSSRKWKELARLSDKFDKDIAGDVSEAAMDAVFNAIKMAIVGWKNMNWPDGKEIEFNPDKLEDMLMPDEAIELMQAAVSQLPTIEDKKKLGLPSISSTGRSAGTVRDRKHAGKSRRKSSR